MATKNLARTVIEGGRTRYHKFERRRLTRCDRHRSRALARLAARDSGNECGFPPRQTLRRWHFDRLSAAERWLGSFVGQPWNAVRAKMARKFDTRTVAGQHIVFDHLLPSVRGSGAARTQGAVYEVDRSGVLRACPRDWPFRGKHRAAVLERRAQANALLWLDGRRVGRRGVYLYWFESTDRFTHEPAFRQTRKLDSAEACRWLEFPRGVQKALSMPLG